MKIKPIFRYNPVARHGTVFRITYENGQKQCSVGFRSKLFEIHKETFGLIITVLGVRVHFKTSYGGKFSD